MTEPTQAQIEAAAKAMQYIDSEAYADNWYMLLAEAALTAAAEVGEPSTQQRERLQDQYIRNVTIERCAQVAEKYQNASPNYIAAAIRKLR